MVFCFFFFLFSWLLVGEQVAFKSLFTKFVYKVELAVTIPIGKYLLIESGSWHSGKNPTLVSK